MSVRRILSPSVSLTVLVLAALLLLLPLTHVDAQIAPSLGAAAGFAVLGGSEVTNTGNSVITGDVGVYPGSSITGFPPGIVVPPGTIHTTDTPAGDAQGATTTAYNALTAQAPGTPAGPDLTGLNLVPGVYSVGAAATNLAGTLTLTGGAADVWIFLMSSSLITSSGSVVSIIGGSPCNVFWQVTSTATIGSGSTFLGNILALTSINLDSSARVSGRLLARNGAVTLINNIVDAGPCGVAAGGVGVSKIFSPSTISLGGISTLTFTFTNTRSVATLQSDFTDNLPSGLVIADTPNLASTCGGSGAPTATPGGSTVTLPAGRTIPGGTVSVPGHCTLTVDVTATLVGRYVNTLAVGALHTDQGNNLFTTGLAGVTGVTLRVSTGPMPVGGEMLTIDQVRVLLPWLGLIMIFSVVAVQTLVIRRRNKAD
jgi:hypothetical protein